MEKNNHKTATSKILVFIGIAFFGIILLIGILSVTMGGVKQVEFIVDDQSYQLVDIKKSKVTFPQDPVKMGYLFIGWFNQDDIKHIESATVKPGLKLYAHWELENYQITYHLDSGIAQNPHTYTVNDQVTISNPTRLGYNFAGWTSNFFEGIRSDVTITEVAKNLVLQANWDLTIYIITYNLNGGVNPSSNPDSFCITDFKVKIANPTKEGYQFIGWSSETFDGLIIDLEIDQIYQSIGLTANFIPIEYN